MPERDYVNDAMDQIIRQCEITPADRDAIRKIIDAAPDLLAACKAALVQIDTLADWSDLPDDVVAETERVVNQLKAAIARAEAVEAFDLDEQGIRAAEKRLALAALDATPTSPIMLPECPNCEHTNWGAICGVCGYDIRDARTVRALAQAGDDAVVLRQEQVRQVRDVIQCYLRPDDLCREQVLQALALLPVTPQ
ncbi:MAG: hypothetical protein QM234_04200 [Acidobacteriota bacterium]|nr:hypothetical protein [Acidobacteriota bacterium]